MVWIKRNLYFLIGSLIAVALMVVFGIRLYTQISDEGKVASEIEAQYSELTRLVSQNPHPGDERINNIQAARDQQATLKAYITKIRAAFAPIQPIPDSTNRVSNADFAAELRNTVTQMRRTAAEQSVVLPPDYYFTFESQKKTVRFDPASLDKLAMALGEIKVLSDVFFDAKVNSLDSVRREVISLKDDTNPSDYLAIKTVSTPLADLTPYEVTFRCFSAELALVLGQLATSSNAFIVKTINIEPTSPSGGVVEEGNNPNEAGSPAAQAAALRRGVRPSAPIGTQTGTGASRGSTVFLNERPFRVTILVNVLRLKPQK